MVASEESSASRLVRMTQAVTKAKEPLPEENEDHSKEETKEEKEQDEEEEDEEEQQEEEDASAKDEDEELYKELLADSTVDNGLFTFFKACVFGPTN